MGSLCYPPLENPLSIPLLEKGGKGGFEEDVFSYQISPNPSLPKRGNKGEVLPKRGDKDKSLPKSEDKGDGIVFRISKSGFGI